jgi:peroxiredoxin Q/BCP
MPLYANDVAPSIVLPNQKGEQVKLSDYKGRWVLVYFYPKDDTPGCTVEACGLRDNLSVLNALKLDVLGISPDSVVSHEKFVNKFKLTFQLLADERKQVVEAYGVWGLKKFMGKEYMGVNRTSFLIDLQGRIAKIYDKVKPEEHPAEVLADVKLLQKK